MSRGGCGVWLTLWWPEVGENLGYMATCIIPRSATRMMWICCGTGFEQETLRASEPTASSPLGEVSGWNAKSDVRSSANQGPAGNGLPESHMQFPGYP